MGIDAYVLLKVRDRAVLKEALQAYAEADRLSWTERGREADYEKLRADGYDPSPLIRPLEDGSAALFTCLSFHDEEMELSVRSWLAAYFGDAIARIHDDPRGVFVYPDVCDPRAKTYDGIIAEIGEAGRFIDPSAPTAEEQAERERAMHAFLAAMEQVQNAHAAGDEAALAKALADGPASVRESWAGAMARSRQMEEMSARIQAGLPAFEVPEIDLGDSEAMQMALGAAGIDLSAVMQRLAESGLGGDGDPLASGVVCLLVPAAIARVIDEETSRLEVQERVDLADGSAMLVTTRLGDEALIAMSLADVLHEKGVNPASLAPFPFFVEGARRLIDDAGAKTFEAARDALGERARLVVPKTFEEQRRADRAHVEKWLRGEV